MATILVFGIVIYFQVREREGEREGGRERREGGRKRGREEREGGGEGGRRGKEEEREGGKIKREEGGREGRREKREEEALFSSTMWYFVLVIADLVWLGLSSNQVL